MRKGKVFYSIYFVCIGLCLAGMAGVVFWLYGWLEDYEASQPTAKCNEVFTELFEQPDWTAIYSMAGMSDTLFEDGDAYASYMAEKVGDSALTLSETSAGLSGNKKYFVRLGEEKLLSYTLISSEGEKGITRWELGEIDLLVNRTVGVRVLKNAEDTVYINGVALDETYTVQRTETLAENYLPEGAHGPRRELQCVEGLLMPPTVQIRNAQGEEQPVYYDEEQAIYVEETSTEEMPESDRLAVLAVARGYCEYMIGASGRLSDFFDSDAEIYQTIRKNETWMQSYASYSFENEQVDGYRCYSDTLFSANVTLSLNVTRKNGTVKEYGLDVSYLFERQGDGSCRAVNMTNVDMTLPVEQVRLVYLCDEEVLWDGYVDKTAEQLFTPTVQAPDGKQFSGWMKETVDMTGGVERVLVFVPDETGNVTLPAGYELTPMTLYPLFE